MTSIGSNSFRRWLESKFRPKEIEDEDEEWEEEETIFTLTILGICLHLGEEVVISKWSDIKKSKERLTD